MFIKICLQESRLLISSGSSQEIIHIKPLIDVTLLRSILPFKPGTMLLASILTHKLRFYGVLLGVSSNRTGEKICLYLRFLQCIFVGTFKLL